ncbi:thioredoxin family protein [Elizabethkingia meningoseptica]|uniref:Thioredoxin n=1 Tax=Elizabethkingia meningoseptica TaxID=238 RepID=A0A1V3TXH8_ELIME|nr:MULTISPECIES: thioredoxin family protein [Elizabethkingia]AQX05360.1 thioredoxin [Elizabethkingia meningoseptica]AQX12924.1 thioredoxin [Elizabethkingia meningoseptica]AQX47402.1 thioredoxin [Elizabethkingia meningoseptica]EJK5330199.1 thioredoxin family protein [Elizabethkingia meningoseptica]EOR31200.1 thioredoxin [Elizabethkingia meningoseptica ATCC 13253 = NBRC 12535]
MNNTEDKIQEIDSLTLLQFYAEWCYPCKMMMPVVNKLKVKLDEWLNVHQVDVDVEQEMAVRYRVRAVPTFVVLKNNQEIWRSSGVLSEDQLEAQLTSLR